jgi:hypothetical protein
MTKPARDRQLDDFAHVRRLHGTQLGRVPVERRMRTGRVTMLANETPERSLKVTLVRDDDVVDQLPAQCSDCALDVRRLPRRTSGDDDLLHAQIVHTMSKDHAVDAIAVPQQVAW